MMCSHLQYWVFLSFRIRTPVLPSGFDYLCVFVFPAGFGGCVDLIVDGVSLMNKMGLTPSGQPLHHDYIENTEQLIQSFAYFFPPGAAAE